MIAAVFSLYFLSRCILSKPFHLIFLFVLQQDQREPEANVALEIGQDTLGSIQNATTVPLLK